jgi:hypothetical protein
MSATLPLGFAIPLVRGFEEKMRIIVRNILTAV